MRTFLVPAPALAALLLVGSLPVPPAIAAPAANGPVAQTAAAATQNMSSQTRRPRPRVKIYRQPTAWPYPRPGTYAWPGPNAVRRCADWYAIEYRPSGTVMTPQMRCWWAAY